MIQSIRRSLEARLASGCVAGDLRRQPKVCNAPIYFLTVIFKMNSSEMN